MIKSFSCPIRALDDTENISPIIDKLFEKGFDTNGNLKQPVYDFLNQNSDKLLTLFFQSDLKLLSNETFA